MQGRSYKQCFLLAFWSEPVQPMLSNNLSLNVRMNLAGTILKKKIYLDFSMVFTRIITKDTFSLTY